MEVGWLYSFLCIQQNHVKIHTYIYISIYLSKDEECNLIWCIQVALHVAAFAQRSLQDFQRHLGGLHHIASSLPWRADPRRPILGRWGRCLESLASAHVANFRKSLELWHGSTSKDPIEEPQGHSWSGSKVGHQQIQRRCLPQCFFVFNTKPKLENTLDSLCPRPNKYVWTPLALISQLPHWKRERSWNPAEWSSFRCHGQPL